MNILFDLFVTFPRLQADLNFEQKAMFTEITKLFIQRLFPLKDEMETDESKERCFVMIHLIPYGGQLENYKVSFTGYSDVLCEKMNASFTDADFQQLNLRLKAVLAGLNN